MAVDTIRIERPSRHIAIVTLDNPPANTFASEDLATVLDSLDADFDVRCVIVTGAGKAFSAGADLKRVEALEDPADMRELVERATDAFRRVEEFRTPVIAAVNGYALGAGLEFALACDLRLAATTATFEASGVNVGLQSSYARLPLLAGMGIAKELLLTGDRVGAEQMLRWNLVSSIHPPEELRDAATARAERIASRAPLAVESVKAEVNTVWHRTTAENTARLVNNILRLRETTDHPEALGSVREKREPTFRRE